MAHKSSWPGLSEKIHSHHIPVNGLNMHILESHSEPEPDHQQPLILLLHGFPELSYSWRKAIIPLSEAGYHVVAPDQRGYGLTSSLDSSKGHPCQYEDDLVPFRMLNLVKDMVALVFALGYRSVAAVIGHDFGSTVAGHCALIRPDLFKSVVMMSAPFTGAPPLPFNVAASAAPTPSPSSQLAHLFAQLELLNPPRKHYTSYFSSADANHDMLSPSEGLHAFFRKYYHVKSGDYAPNDPHRLPSTSASDMAEMPEYYIMPLHQTMPDAISLLEDTSLPSQTAWLPEAELAIYVSEFTRTGFQGGLNWYRCMLSSEHTADLGVFSGKNIDVPAMFIGGKKDWGVYQTPGGLEAMRDKLCVKMEDGDVVIVEGAGHWVQQEKPEEVVGHILGFLRKSLVA